MARSLVYVAFYILSMIDTYFSDVYKSVCSKFYSIMYIVCIQMMSVTLAMAVAIYNSTCPNNALSTTLFPVGRTANHAKCMHHH